MLFCSLGFFALASPAKATRLPAAPSDTVVGYAHLVRHLSREICAKLSDDHKTNFNSLTPTQAMEMTHQIFGAALKRDSTAVLALATTAAQQNISLQRVSKSLGSDVVLQLSQGCLASLPLLARFSQTEQVQQAMGANRPTSSDAENKVLQPIATRLCAQLAAINAETPLAKQTPTQRRTLLNHLTDKGLTESQTALLRYYSAAQLTDRSYREEIGYKVVLLMVAQPSCGPHVLLLGASEIGHP